MEVEAGSYYRRKDDGAIVKVLHPQVFPHECSCGALGWECMGDEGDNQEAVVYRMREGKWPTRSYFVEAATFADSFEGPLDWDTALKEFK